MTTYDAGDARLKIFPDASGFKQKLEADLKKVDVDFKIPVHPSLAQASADLERWRQQQQRNPVELKVEVDTATATAKVAGLKKTLDGLKLGQNGVGGALLANAGALGVGSLPAVATVLANVAGAIQQVSGAGLALPGALAGIAAVAGTVKVGMTGVSDAFDAVEKSSDGTAKSIEAANAALAKLAPSAADAVKAAADIKKQLADALVAPSQQNLFDGLGDSARKLVNADLPIVQRGMAGLATALNGNAKQLLASLGSDSSQSFLDRIFGNTTDAQTRLTAAIDPIVHAVGALSATGSDALPRLADGVGKVADRFDRFITAADGDGRLDKWINDGITGLSQLGETVLNIGKSLTAITQAAGGDGGLLGTLEGLTGQLATFLNSDQGQADLGNFFREGREQLAQWGPILANIARTLPGIYAASKQWTDALLPPLREITAFLAEHPNLIQGVATAFLAWKSIDGVAALVGKLGGIGSSLDALPGKATGAAGGISSALSKIVIPAAIAGLTVNQTSGMIGPDQSAASNVGGGALNIAGGAAAGGLAFGAPGAIVGAIAGLGASVYQRVLSDIQAGQKAFEARWTSDHNNPDRVGNPDTANALTGRDRLLQPSLNTPAISASLLPAIKAGQVKGFAVGPDGQIVNTDTGQTVNVPGLNLAPAPPTAPPAPKPPVSIPRLPNSLAPTPAGIPIPAAPSSAAAVPAPVAVPNPITAGTTIAAKVDPAAQQSVDKLATSIQSLPKGEVKITDGSPAVLESVKKLDVQVSTLKDHPGEVIVKANTEEAQSKLDALIRSYQSRIITLQLQPSMGGGPPLPVAPGKATGGINGILPGYSPGVDNMLVPMSGGEGVIVPQVTRQLGPAGIAAINAGALTRGYATGGIVDPFGNPINPGAAPGPGGFVPGAGPSPIAPNGAGGGGAGGILSSVLSGIQGPIGNALALGQGLAGAAGGGQSGSGTGSFMDRLAGIPGIAGLVGSAGSSNPGEALTNWGSQTGKWLGSFTEKTVGGFGNALWQGALGLVGLENSVLSPNNPWFQAAAQGAGFALDGSGPLGALLGVGGSGSSSGAIDPKRIRDGGQKVTRADQKVAQIMQRIRELKPNASQSARQSLADQLLNAQQEASDARADLSALAGGADPGSAALPAGTAHHGGPDGLLTPMAGGEGIIDPEIAAKLGPAGIAAINQGKLPIAKKGFAFGGINTQFPNGVVLPQPSTAAARAAVAQPIAPRGSAQIPSANTKQLPGPIAAGPAPSAPPAPAAPAAPPQPGFTPGVGAAPISTAPTGDALNHNLSAINTGISSAASAIGQAASTAIGAAAGAGAGAAGIPGIGAAGAIGPYVAGLIQQGGKIVSDVVNVGSSFLVGSVPGNLQQGPAQGELMTAPQNVPNTATDNRRNYVFNGIDSRNVVDDIRLKDAQDSQGELARYRG